MAHCEVRGLQSPEPIALGTAGDIHPRSATVTEEVLHLDDGCVCGAVEATWISMSLGESLLPSPA